MPRLNSVRRFAVRFSLAFFPYLMPRFLPKRWNLPEYPNSAAGPSPLLILFTLFWYFENLGLDTPSSIFFILALRAFLSSLKAVLIFLAFFILLGAKLSPSLLSKSASFAARIFAPCFLYFLSSFPESDSGNSGTKSSNFPPPPSTSLGLPSSSLGLPSTSLGLPSSSLPLSLSPGSPERNGT